MSNFLVKLDDPSVISGAVKAHYILVGTTTTIQAVDAGSGVYQAKVASVVVKDYASQADAEAAAAALADAVGEVVEAP